MFSRTSSGIKNTHLFYRGFYIVIVEGETDKPFWSLFFPDEINGYKKWLKSVGGREEVQKYIDELLLNRGHFVVAVDSDYRFLLKNLYQHSRILETKYHSIENLMLCASVITYIIRCLSYNIEYEELEANNWLKHFDESTHPLMIADLIIEKNHLGKECVGDNCSRFLINKKKPYFDNQKINCFIQNLNLSMEDFDEVYRKLEKVQPRFHIRGHFFFSAVLCFIIHEVKKHKSSVSISNDALYALLISRCESRIEVDPVLQLMQEKAVSAANEVTNFLSQVT